MNFFKTKTTWSNAEFIPVKLCIAFAYIMVGTYFHSFFENYYTLLFILFAITAVWAVGLWINKMKNTK